LADLNVSVHFIRLNESRMDVPHLFVQQRLAAFPGAQEDAKHPTPTKRAVERMEQPSTKELMIWICFSIGRTFVGFSLIFLGRSPTIGSRA
jgi:hypothetical protein